MKNNFIKVPESIFNAIQPFENSNDNEWIIDKDLYSGTLAIYFRSNVTVIAAMKSFLLPYKPGEVVQYRIPLFEMVVDIVNASVSNEVKELQLELLATNAIVALAQKEKDDAE